MATRHDVEEESAGGHVQVEAAPGLAVPIPVVVLHVVVENVLNLFKGKLILAKSEKVIEVF
jgi:hypothetical protein